MDDKYTTAYEKLQSYVEKFGVDKLGDEIKNSLVRLTKHYREETLEEAINKIIKGEIFTYVFFPEHDERMSNHETKEKDEPVKVWSERCSEAFHALTTSQANYVISFQPSKVELLRRGYYFGIDDLWISKFDLMVRPVSPLSSDGAVTAAAALVSDTEELKGETLEGKVPSTIAKPDNISNTSSTTELSTNKQKTRAKSKTRQRLENFVAHLVAAGNCDSYTKFINYFKENHFFPSRSKVDYETEAYNNHEDVKHVYFVKENNAEKNVIKVHFSFADENGRLKKQKIYSSSSFKKIFDEIIARSK